MDLMALPLRHQLAAYHRGATLWYMGSGAFMKTCLILLLLTAVVCSFDTSAHAQASAKVARVGVLQFESVGGGAAFLRQLKEMGYEQGRNIAFEYRQSKGQHGLLPNMAADLVRLRVDVIVANGPTAIGPAMK